MFSVIGSSHLIKLHVKLPKNLGHSYESLSIPRAKSGKDYASQEWITIFGHPANLMRQTFLSLTC